MKKSKNIAGLCSECTKIIRDTLPNYLKHHVSKCPWIHCHPYLHSLSKSNSVTVSELEVAARVPITSKNIKGLIKKVKVMRSKGQ
jgi:hypothetical protein